MKIIDTLEVLEREVLTAVSAIINRHSDNIVLVETTVLVENIVILGVVLHDRTLLRCSVEGTLVTLAIQINGVDSILSMKITTTSGSYTSSVIENVDPTICQDFLHKYDLKKVNTPSISKHVVQQEVVIGYSIYFTREELVALHSIASNSEASQLRTIILDMCKQTIGEESTENECNKLLTKFK